MLEGFFLVRLGHVSGSDLPSEAGVREMMLFKAVYTQGKKMMAERVKKEQDLKTRQRKKMLRHWAMERSRMEICSLRFTLCVLPGK